jgi:sulfur carrier protein ThiS
LETQNRSPELWKQVDENLIRLSPPHTFTTLAAYDWVTAHINLKDAEALIASEIEWMEGQPRPTPPQRTLSDLIDQAQFGARLCAHLHQLKSR